MIRANRRRGRAMLLAAFATTGLALLGCRAAPSRPEGAARTTSPSVSPTSPLAVLDDPALAAPPGFRACCVFGYDLRALIPFVSIENVLDPSELTEHRYGGALLEDNGLLYTRRGGFLDTGHVRDYADWTGHLAAAIARLWSRGGPIPLPPHGGGPVIVRLAPQRGPLDAEVAIRIAQRIAFELSVWHEIATWYGWRSVRIYPEELSAFSPEDIYSNLIGVQVGAAAIRRRLASGGGLDWGDAVDGALAEVIDPLGPVDAAGTRLALDLVQGEHGWWDRSKRIPQAAIVRRRYVEAGPSLSPWLVPVPGGLGGPELAGRPRAASVPTTTPSGALLATLYRLEIAPDRALMPALPAAPPGAPAMIEPSAFPAILAHARAGMRARFGPDAHARPRRAAPIAPLRWRPDDGRADLEVELLAIPRAGVRVPGQAIELGRGLAARVGVGDPAPIGVLYAGSRHGLRGQSGELRVHSLFVELGPGGTIIEEPVGISVHAGAGLGGSFFDFTRRADAFGASLEVRGQLGVRVREGIELRGGAGYFFSGRPGETIGHGNFITAGAGLRF